MKKRITAMLLALCMVLSICVPIAVADDEQPEEKAVVPECSCWGASLGLPLSSHGVINNCDRQNFCKEEVNTTVSHMVYNWADYPDDVKTYLVELLTGDEAYAEKYAELQKELKLEDNRPQITVEDKSPTVGGYKPSVSVEGQTVRMDKYAKATLSAGADTTWQICIDPTDIWQWADITGGQGSLTVSYGLVGSLLTEINGEHTAYLRAYRTYEDGEAQLRAYSKIYTIVMDLSEPDLSESQSFPNPDFEEMTPSDAAPASMEEPAPASTEEPAPVATETDSAAAGANAVIPASLSETGAETGDVIEPSVTTAEPTFIQPVPAFPQADEQDEQTPKTYDFVINYIFENGDIVADPYTASIGEGTSFTNKVEFPTIQGYLPYIGEEQVDSYTFAIDSASEDITINVVYKPTNVNFTVIYYQQNVDNDKYTEKERETLSGLNGSPIPEVKKTYDGFYQLLYEQPKIAADGSTVVEIYYDREYYLMNFELDGGYGVEPIYAKYGTEISIGKPTKPGYTFNGWDKEIPASMPAENTTFKANWTPGESGFTVVFWYENADDAEYSFAGSYKPKNVESGTKVSSGDYRNQNFKGRDDAHFTYNADKAENNITVAGDGSTILNVYFTRNTYTLTFVDGTERVLTCTKEEHRHSNSCCEYGGTSWSHWLHSDSCCKLGKEEHSHNNRCYSTQPKVVATITAKWNAKIYGEFNRAPFNTTYSGRAWKCTDTSKFNYALQTLDRMPGFDATFNLYGQNSDTKKTIYYYVQKVGTTVNTNRWPTSNANFDLMKQVDTYFNYATYNEEYHEIEGFERYSRTVAGFDNDNSKNFSNNRLNLYYMRKSYTLRFYNFNSYVSGQDHSVQYEASLNSYNFAPEYPSGLEKGAYQFGGWYTTENFYDGTEVSWNTATMPAADLVLYAKWIPVKHTVKTYLTKDAMTGEPLSIEKVDHGATAKKTEDPTNGEYVFVGWFYEEDGAEHAFDFSMPITKDLNLYAKWSSNVLIDYTVIYKIKDTDTEIAERLKSSGLAGMTKTFEAKGGNDLKEGYREGYFPTAKSQSLALKVEEPNPVLVFEYVAVPSVPYTVKYLDQETGESLIKDKIVEDNKKAVVTETFVPIKGYLPDAYQKRLVVTAEGDNILIFYYKKDDQHAYYKITHYIQGTDGQTWIEYTSSQVIGDIGKSYRAEPTTISGFTFDKDVDGTVQEGILTLDGLELKLYYTRNKYAYEVRYLEKNTGRTLHEPKTGTDYWGKVISESAVDLSSEGYTPEKTSDTLIIRIEAQLNLNVITFYYEQNITISYEIVGPTGCGSLTCTNEKIGAVTGEPKGSTPTAAPGFKFVGWYIDKNCINRVDGKIPNAVDPATNKLTPQKGESGEHYEWTYYAKFEYDVFDLTVSKTGAAAIDENQTFIFLISGEGVKMEVVVHGNSSVTVKGLKVGTYTVTELTDWSWRYKPDETKKTVSQANAQQAAASQTAHTVNFVNTRTNNKWLNGAAYCDNHWINSATVEIN